MEIGVDTIVDIARRNGKRVGAIAFPFMDGTSPRRTPDFGIAWTTPVVRSRIVHLTRSDFHSEWLPPAWGAPRPRHISFSPAMRARLAWSVPQVPRIDVDLAAYDTTDDHVENDDPFWIETRSFDLLLAYQPIIDEAEHQYLNASGEPVRRAAYVAFDHAVAEFTRDIASTGGAIVITGDHGLAPVDTEVRVNRILSSWNETQWTAFANGNSTHIYRLGGDDDTEALITKLRDLKSPDGANVFERVDRKQPTSHPNSGDIIA